MSNELTSFTSARYRDSDFKFFKLTLLSCKVNYLHFRVVKSMDVNELYNQTKYEPKVSFNKYHPFI